MFSTRRFVSKCARSVFLVNARRSGQHQAFPNGKASEFDAIVNAEFIHDSIFVTVDGLLREMHLLGNLFHAVTPSEMSQNFQLPVGQQMKIAVGSCHIARSRFVKNHTFSHWFRKERLSIDGLVDGRAQTLERFTFQ